MNILKKKVVRVCLRSSLVTGSGPRVTSFFSGFFSQAFFLNNMGVESLFSHGSLLELSSRALGLLTMQLLPIIKMTSAPQHLG
jgi:hypothetical protein